MTSTHEQGEAIPVLTGRDRAITPERMLRTALLIWCVGTISAWLIGPFGTFVALDGLARLGYWASIIGLATIIGVLIRYAVGLYFDLTRSRGIFTTAIIQSVAIGPVLWALNGQLSIVPANTLVSLAYHVVIAGNICLVLALIRWWAATDGPMAMSEATDLAVDQDGGRSASDVTEVPSSLGPMISRVADEIGTDVSYAGADGHYVHIETPRGSARVLMRFSDGMEELERLDGFRVHRSHWVARRAIQRLEQQGQKTFVVLYCGRRVPVSRTYRCNLPRLRAAAGA